MANSLDLLTAMQRRYVDNIAQGLRPVEAARTAGYRNPKEDARDLNKNPKVRAEIERLQREARKRNDLSIDDVLDGFMDSVRMAQNSMELTAAWREIGRVIGAYQPKQVEVKVDVNDERTLRHLPTHELAKLAGELDALPDDEILEGEFEEVPDDD